MYDKFCDIINLLIITAFSVSAFGCSTLRALEPTAILIADIAKAL